MTLNQINLELASFQTVTTAEERRMMQLSEWSSDRTVPQPCWVKTILDGSDCPCDDCEVAR